MYSYPSLLGLLFLSLYFSLILPEAAFIVRYAKNAVIHYARLLYRFRGMSFPMACFKYYQIPTSLGKDTVILGF
jgi:hypothetical protein